MRIALLLCLLSAGPLWAGEPIRIAVAANFKSTLESVSESFLADSGYTASYSSASTGVLATQIEQGAQYDLFFAADKETAQRILALQGHANDESFCYARGALALAGGDGSLSALARPQSSLAIANPATAPYGRAAMEVLARPEFKAGEGRKLVRGNSVAQVYQFWESGAVDLALLPRSLVPTSATPVPLDWYQPMEQYAVVLRQSDTVAAYLHFLHSDRARRLIQAAGYEPCP